MIEIIAEKYFSQFLLSKKGEEEQISGKFPLETKGWRLENYEENE